MFLHSYVMMLLKEYKYDEQRARERVVQEQQEPTTTSISNSSFTDHHHDNDSLSVRYSNTRARYHTHPWNIPYYPHSHTRIVEYQRTRATEKRRRRRNRSSHGKTLHTALISSIILLCLFFLSTATRHINIMAMENSKDDDDDFIIISEGEEDDDESSAYTTSITGTTKSYDLNKIELPQQQQQQRNIVEEIWHTIQKMAQNNSNNKVKSKKIDVAAITKDSSNNQVLHTISKSQQQQILQAILQQQQQQGDDESTTTTTSSTTTTSKTTTDNYDANHAHNLLNINVQRRRQSLYQHAVQQYYASQYMTHTAITTTNRSSSLQSTTTSTVTNSSSKRGNADDEREHLEQEHQYNQTVWDLASHAYNTYTYSTNNNRRDDHIDYHQEETYSDANGNTKDHTTNRKIDRTTLLHDGLPPIPYNRIHENKHLIEQMFYYGYDHYMYRAYPAGEIRPISCTPGTFSLVQIPALTLIDALDTLLVFNNVTEFARSVERLRYLHTNASSVASSMFAIDQNVSVFETNIRILGGLLSAHQLAIALQLDRPIIPENNNSSNNHHDINKNGNKIKKKNKVLLMDVLDPSNGNVKWGRLQHSSFDIVERWRRYKQEQSEEDRILEQQHLQEYDITSKLGEDDHDFVTDTTTRSTLSIQSDIIASTFPMSPCDSASLLQNSPFVVEESNTCISLSSPRYSIISRPTPSSDTCPVKVTVTNTTTSKSSTIVSPSTTTSTANDDATTTTIFDIPTSDLWIYDGLLLDLAYDIGNRLLPAFSTTTGIPYGTVNLLYGVPKDETTIASLAGGGTLSIEFELLSRLTGDVRFGKAAKLAARSLFRYRSKMDLFGKHIDIHTGTWVETLSGIGSNSDSYLEYLAKHYMLFPEDDDFWIMFKAAYAGVRNESRVGEWYADVDMNHGTSEGQSRRVFESLAAFYPGLQVLLGEIGPAARSLNSMTIVREIFGFLPERFNYGIWNLDHNRDGAGIHPLRPELLESNYLMHRATKGIGSVHSSYNQSSGWQWAADYALHKLVAVTHAQCGFAGVRELKPHTTGSLDSNTNDIVYIDEMPSFFLTETLKYLYLTFDENNILHEDTDRQWLFTTEAHPVHYVPLKSTSSLKSDMRDVTKDIKTVKDILRNRMKQKDANFHTNSKKTSTRYDNSFFRGKWTKPVNNLSYRDDILQVLSMKLLHRPIDTLNNTSAINQHMLAFVPTGAYLTDSFDENRLHNNIAHLAVSNWGSGMKLQKNCPNVYSSDLLWTHALNGGATDYTDTYISTGYDTLLTDPHYFTQFGAAEAIGFYGIGIYYGESDMVGDVCPLNLRITEAAAPTEPTEIEEPLTDNELTNVESEEGSFEVSTFPQGGGFQVRHVSNEEVIKASIVGDDSLLSGAIAIVHSELCTKKWILKTSDGDDVRMTREKKRRTSIADFNGNSFSCEIKVFREGNVSSEDDSQREKSEIAVIPCTPAAFGPTHILQLKELGTITVEAKLFGPSEDNTMGCKEPISPRDETTKSFLFSEDATMAYNSDDAAIKVAHSDNMKANAIHMVHRGICTFFAKAVNMYTIWNVDALIVVNNSDESFMMSSSQEELQSVDPLDIPITVLVSEDDGIHVIDSMNKEGLSSFSATIEIKRSYDSSLLVEAGVDDKVAIASSEINWPIIRGNNNYLQVFAEFGWGIHAVNKVEGQYHEWHVTILKHSLENQGQG